MKAKNKGGRPRFVIDYQKLDGLCAIHCTGEEISEILGCEYHALDNALKRDKKGGFLQYYKKKSSMGKMSLRRRQFKAAEAGSIPMMIWLGKQYLGQKDHSQIEQSGPGGGPIKTQNEYKVTFISSDGNEIVRSSRDK